MKLSKELQDHLSQEDQNKLSNSAKLPYGEATNIIRKVDPLFGRNGTKKFEVEIERIITKAEIQTITMDITAYDDKEAQKIGQELAAKEKINFDDSKYYPQINESIEYTAYATPKKD